MLHYRLNSLNRILYIRQLQILVKAQICTWLIVYKKKGIENLLHWIFNPLFIV